MFFRVIKIPFRSLVFKEMLSFSILLSMDMAMQLKRVSIALDGTCFDMYTRSKGFLSRDFIFRLGSEVYVSAIHDSPDV